IPISLILRWDGSHRQLMRWRKAASKTDLLYVNRKRRAQYAETGASMNKTLQLQGRKPGSRFNERGQTMVFLVLGLSLGGLAVVGFAVDVSNMWFHRQRAQNAADAACTAAIMDMLPTA